MNNKMILLDRAVEKLHDDHMTNHSDEVVLFKENTEECIKGIQFNLGDLYKEIGSLRSQLTAIATGNRHQP